MNRIKLVLLVFVFICIFCIIGIFFIQGDKEIDDNVSALDSQYVFDEMINAYGYSVDNPNIIVDPYNSNYNSALIMFETDDYVSIRVNINNEYIYDSVNSRIHYIGVYNLYDGDNSVILSGNGIYKVINIKINSSSDKLVVNDMIVLNNNHFIIPTYEYLSNGSYTGFREIDIFGKIYYEYILDNGYNGKLCEIDSDKFAIFSDKLYIIDRQNGNVINSFEIEDKNWVDMFYYDNKIILSNGVESMYVLEDGSVGSYERNVSSNVFLGDVNYKKISGVRFYNKKSTSSVKDNIYLLSYKKLSKDVKFDISKEFNRLVVSVDDSSYLILDKLFDRKVYELNKGINYIYTGELNGKYSIYLKVNDNIYKTNKFINY